jgi:acyl-CoA thioesterase I
MRRREALSALAACVSVWPSMAAAQQVVAQNRLPCSPRRSATSCRPDPVTIVAVGASNTSGWGVGEQNAYPARLQALLRLNGIEARVINAGEIFDTTAGMLRRINSDVPDGTRLVILQPGANDLRFFGTLQRRTANIAAIESVLRTRGIDVILFDPVFPPDYYSFDGIHFTADAHDKIAARLLPSVLAALRKRKGG